MRKTILFVALIFIVNNTIAQTSISNDSLLNRINTIETNNYKASLGIDKFVQRQGVGILLSIAGTGTTLIGINRNDKTLRRVGPALSAIGIAVWLSSYSGLSLASKYLKGNKLVIPIKSRKKK